MDEVTLLDFMDPYARWMDPAFQVQMPATDRIRRYQRVGLFDQHQELTTVGLWLLRAPPKSTTIWTHKRPKVFLEGPPMTFIPKVLDRTMLPENRTRFEEQLAWLLVGPHFYSCNGGTMPPPHFDLLWGSFTSPRELQLTVSRQYLGWVLKEGYKSPVTQVLQRGGVIRHSRLEEFWEQAKVLTHRMGTQTVTIGVPEVTGTTMTGNSE